MVFLGLLGYRDGSPNKLLAPFDYVLKVVISNREDTIVVIMKLKIMKRFIYFHRVNIIV